MQFAIIPSPQPRKQGKRKVRYHEPGRTTVGSFMLLDMLEETLNLLDSQDLRRIPFGSSLF